MVAKIELVIFDLNGFNYGKVDVENVLYVEGLPVWFDGVQAVVNVHPERDNLFIDFGCVGGLVLYFSQCEGFGNLDASMAEGFPDCTQCREPIKKLCKTVTFEKMETIRHETDEYGSEERTEQESGYIRGKGIF